MKKTFFSLFDKVIDLINAAIYVIVALAILGFMWGIVKVLFSADSEKIKKEGRSFMMYGVLTLFVMTSIWGLVNLLQGTITVEEADTYYEGFDNNITPTNDQIFENVKNRLQAEMDAQNQNQTNTNLEDNREGDNSANSDNLDSSSQEENPDNTNDSDNFN